MKKRYTLILTILFCVFMGGHKLCAQDKIADSLQLHRITDNMAGMFNKAVTEQSRLYNGPEFVPYTFLTTTNANFRDTTDFYNGSVNYDGIVYTNVPLIYNIERDLLVSKLYNNVSLYTLLSDRVSEFDILGHHFIRINIESTGGPVETGFYEELYNNKVLVLVRHAKDVEKQPIKMGTGKFFVERTDYFLKKGDKYYNINSEGKLYDALKDKKKELKQYVKDNKIRYGDNPEHVMAQLAAYYDHITN